MEYTMEKEIRGKERQKKKDFVTFITKNREKSLSLPLSPRGKGSAFIFFFFQSLYSTAQSPDIGPKRLFLAGFV
jgi:hypothetical protein